MARGAACIQFPRFDIVINIPAPFLLFRGGGSKSDAPNLSDAVLFLTKKSSEHLLCFEVVGFTGCV